jgi:CSLREA domain-containing protein
MRPQSRRNLWYGAVLGVVLSVGSAPAWALVTVTSTGDGGGSCPGVSCTLRAAIAAAAIDTIQFGAGVVGTITLTSGELLLSTNLTITGPGTSQLAISGNNASRVMQVADGVTVSISGLTIRNGNDNTLGGGGIFNQGGTVTVSSSTFSGNSADVGGGIFNNSGTVMVNSSTFSGNRATNGGGIYNDGIPQFLDMRLSSTIIANSPSGGNCFVAGGITSQGDNISSDGTCVTTSIPLNDRNNTNPRLNALANNGGPTLTHALQNTSPAINEVRNIPCSPGTDQRGVVRPTGPRCDIGAFESPDTTPVELQEFVVE